MKKTSFKTNFKRTDFDWKSAIENQKGTNEWKTLARGRINKENSSTKKRQSSLLKTIKGLTVTIIIYAHAVEINLEICVPKKSGLGVKIVIDGFTASVQTFLQKLKY